jgi:hypothetical protein
MPPGMTEAAGSASTGSKFRNDRELRPHDGHDDQLCDAFADRDGERRMTTIPARYQQFALIITVDQSDQIAQHDAVLVAQAGTG